ncbi:MAG: DUF123 domain-containing protein [Promethearchaeota archaeon]
MKGAYALVIEIERPIKVRIKSLGVVSFGAGSWVYVGSAMGRTSTSLERRIERHFRSQKSVYWHIDHLLAEKVHLAKAVWAESVEHVECDIAQLMQGREEFEVGPLKFGASDCRRGCKSHIFRISTKESEDDIVKDVFKTLGLHGLITADGRL